MEIQFYCEFTLYRVAKQLRLLGYDCFCEKNCSTQKLVELWLMHPRVILTTTSKLKDELLRALRKQQKIFKQRQWEVYSDDDDNNNNNQESAQNKVSQTTSEIFGNLEPTLELAHRSVLLLPRGWAFVAQMQWVWDQVGLSFNPHLIFSRCIKCGDKIEPVDKSFVKGRVYPSIYVLYSEFYYCLRCEKVYWGMNQDRELCNWKTMHTLKFAERFSMNSAMPSAAVISPERGLSWKLHPFRVLPKRLKLKVLAYLTVQELCLISLVGKSYYELINQDEVWLGRVSSACPNAATTLASRSNNTDQGLVVDDGRIKGLAPCEGKLRYLLLQYSKTQNSSNT